MQQARGGILFIDEAHGLYTPTGNFYAREAVEALVGHITEKEFKGNLLVIMSGYPEELNSMFSRANPGLRSRFDKIRVNFPSWTSEQAALAVITAVEEEGKKLTNEAESALRRSFERMVRLPSWASARDVFEKIIPAMYTQRASRLATNLLVGSPEISAAEKSDEVYCCNSSTKQGFGCGSFLLHSDHSCVVQQLPYDVSDVMGAFQHSLGEDETILALNSKTELIAAIDSARVSHRLLVVNVYCEMYECELSAGTSQAFEDLNKEFLDYNVLFAKMKLQTDFNLNELDDAMPMSTFLCFYNGVEEKRLIGTNVLALRQFIVSFMEKASRRKFSTYFID